MVNKVHSSSRGTNETRRVFIDLLREQETVWWWWKLVRRWDRWLSVIPVLRLDGAPSRFQPKQLNSHLFNTQGFHLGWNAEFTGLIISGFWFVPRIYASQANGKLILASCVVILGWTTSLQPSRVRIRAVVVMSKPGVVRQPSGVLLGWKWEQLLNLYSCQVCQQLEGHSVEDG